MIRKVLTAAVLASTAGLVGCQGKNEANGFLDPTATGRFDPNRPLVVPILSHLDVGLEEANGEFQSATEVRPEDLDVHAEDYRIQANDVVTVTISDLAGPGSADQVVTRRVTESGRVGLPLIGQVSAAGRSEVELEKEIAAAYKSGGLITNAQVSVVVTEARGRTFTLLGPGTQHAGQYPMYKSDFRVTDALAATGGELPFSDVLYVIRDNKKGGASSATAPSSTSGGATESGAGTAPGAQPQRPGSDNPAAALEPAQPTTPGVKPATTPGTGAQQTPPPAPPASAPAAGGTGEGRIVIIDGKPVLIEGGQTQPVTPGAAQPPAAGTPADATPSAPAGNPPAAAQPSSPELQPQTSDEPFAFNRMSNDGQRIIRVSLKALRQGDFKNNIVIKPGDTLFIPGPVVGEYYVGGHVNQPGVFSLTGRDITLTQAIVSARMFDQIAIPRRTEIRRRLGPDREVVISVDMDAVYAGTQPNVYVRPNDEIYVGTNAFAPFLAAIRGGFRMTYGFGFLYDRNYAAKENNAGINGR